MTSTRAKLTASLTLVAIVLGMMVTIQYRQTANVRALDEITDSSDTRTKQLTQQLASLQKEGQSEQARLQKVNGQLTAYEQETTSDDTKLQDLQARLSSARILAGTTPVTGPGIEFTVNDGTPPAGQSAQDYLTHDWLVRQLVNELFATGAEAVSINGYRIVATSGIFCRGPVITVNGNRMTAPFDFKAIGNAHLMSYGLQMAGGEFDILKGPGYNLNISPLQTKTNLSIAAYSGTVNSPPTTTGN